MKVAVPLTVEPLLGSRVAFPDGGAAAAADADVPPALDAPPDAQLKTKAPAAASITEQRILILILSSLILRWETIHPAARPVIR